jgi:RNA polymerase sigma factor (sigma-70 family)
VKFKAYPTNEDVAAAAAGDRLAMDRVVRGCEGLCYFAAQRYTRQTHLEVSELVQQARIAVLSAVGAFKPEFGVQFHTYAFRWMRALLMRLVIDENPGDQRNRRHRVSLGKPRGGPPVPARHLSIEGPAGFDEDGPTLAEVLPDAAPSPEEVLAEREQAEQVNLLTFTVLHDVDRVVVRERAHGRTLQAIADGMDLSRERVRQIQKRGMERLREAAQRQGLS